LPVRLLVAASLAAVTALAAKPHEFPQATRVHGKVPVNLSAAWFLYAQAQFPGTKPARSRRGRIAPSRARSCATLACAHFFSTRNAQYAPTSEALRCHEAIAFVLHQCAAQRRPAAGAPLSPPPHGRGTNSLTRRHRVPLLRPTSRRRHRPGRVRRARRCAARRAAGDGPGGLPSCRRQTHAAVRRGDLGHDGARVPRALATLPYLAGGAVGVADHGRGSAGDERVTITARRGPLATTAPPPC